VSFNQVQQEHRQARNGSAFGERQDYRILLFNKDFGVLRDLDIEGALAPRAFASDQLFQSFPFHAEGRMMEFD
jgi:hypothetical protein